MDYEKRWKELLLPCVRIHAGRAGGSGTVLYSKESVPGEYSTYVLTNCHVVNDLIKVESRWSTLLKRDVKADILGVPTVDFFEYRWQSRAIGARTIEADIVTYDKDEDLALLHLRSEQKFDAALLYPRGKERELRATMPLYTVGAGLGENPVITSGMLSQFGREIDNREYWLNTAPSIFGNSGGAVFLEETHELIGVPARIAVSMTFYDSDPITHLSYCVPITRVYTFLEAQLFRFIYDTSFTEAGEAEARTKKRIEEEHKVFRGEVVGHKEPENAD